jgi:hypothetical protein
MRIWFALAEGKTADALKAIDASEKEAQPIATDHRYDLAPLNRAWVHVETGKPKDAIAQADVALTRLVRSERISGFGKKTVRWQSLAARGIAEARLGKKAEAEKTAAMLDEEARAAPSNAWLQSTAHTVHGVISLAAGDAKRAAAHFAQCTEEDSYCRWQLAQAQEKAGDKAAAAATREKLLARIQRDPFYLYVRSRLAAQAPAKK